MTRRSDAIAITLLKRAGALQVGESLAKGLKGVAVSSADLGAGLAKGLGAHENIGRAAGVAALGGATLLGGRKVRNEARELKYRMTYGNGY